MVQVELSSVTFERLQKLAIPLVDTIETVVNRLLDERQAKDATGSPRVRSAEPSRLAFASAAPPPLTHTKVLSITFDGKSVTREVTWAGLLREAIRRLPNDAKTPDALRRLIVVNFVTGQKTDEGYRYLPEAGISLQGQDAADAAKAAFHIAKQMGWPLEVEFVWRNKPGAAHPGQVGVLKTT